MNEQGERIFFGHVIGCLKLNIRDKPDGDAEILAQVPLNTEVMIYIDSSTDDWYAVCIPSGIEGYCMKRYIDVEP